MKNFVLTPEMLRVLGDDISADRKNAVVRALTNNWAFIVYPESAPNNWIDILQEYYIPFAVSPLHDKDINPDGENKKPHYHVLITSDSKKNFVQLFEMAQRVCGSYLMNVGNAGGYYRYFIHLDHPDKYQYDEKDIKLFCGFNPDKYVKPSSSVRFAFIKEMIHFIEENNILDFCDFLNICAVQFDEWFRLLCDNSCVIISKFIDSRRRKHFSQLVSDSSFNNYV